MWFEEADGVAELFKGILPYYLLIVLPIFIIISPANPVAASHEFAVNRMQQYDLHGVPHGCRSAAVNLEARSLIGWGTSRHCVVVKLQDLSVDHFRDIRAKAGALLVILPKEILALSTEEKQHLMLLEDAMMVQEVSIPVYFAVWTPELEEIVTDITYSFITDDKAGSAAEAILNSISANGYQIVISPGSTSAKQEIKIATLQGKLNGAGTEGKIPTIALVAHYDSFGVAPELAFGADANGSGVAMLMEIARLFSHLYSNTKSIGKYNIVFLLTGGGKFNYQGSKKWLEDQLDSLEGSVIQDASYVVCLDTLSAGDSLYMHVSKPPKEGSPSSAFFKHLKSAADKYPAVTVDGVHKKINLADELLAWEHERFSIRRLPAFTLSSLKSHRDMSRATILDTKATLDLDRLVRHTHIVAEAMAKHIYNLTAGELFSHSLKVEKSHLEMWLNYLTAQPRSAQMLCDKNNPLVNTLKASLTRYLKDVKVTYASPDKREPEFMFYDVTHATVNVYSVKPAVFDLVLTFAIILYLGGVYLFMQYFPCIYSAACLVASSSKKTKVN